MRVYELDALECAQLLSKVDLGRLGCAHHDQPYIVPIHFAFDPHRKSLFAFSSVGRKINWMRENPKVCVEVEQVEDKDHWTTVLVFGRFYELGDSADDVAARDRAKQLFERRPEWWFPAAAKTWSSEPDAVLIYGIRIDHMSGRRASRDRP